MKLIIVQGIPGSGKSTWARNYIKEREPNEIVIVNRDSIREMLGTYWVPDREPLVSEIEMFMIEEALNRKYDVIIDATNLNPKTIKKWNRIAKEWDAEITYKKFPIALEEAIERDKNRERTVGEDTIRYFYNKYKDYFEDVEIE